MIIVDTGFWLALANDRDQYHQQATQALSRVDEPLITTWCVVTETCYLLLTRLGNFAQVRFMESLSSEAIAIFDLHQSHNSQLATLMKRYADLPMDLTDASLIILAEHLGHGRILSVDQRDFNTYRWKNTQPFHNLLFDRQ
jgi:uncharacterized protein